MIIFPLTVTLSADEHQQLQRIFDDSIRNFCEYYTGNEPAQFLVSYLRDMHHLAEVLHLDASSLAGI